MFYSALLKITIKIKALYLLQNLVPEKNILMLSHQSPAYLLLLSLYDFVILIKY